MYLKMPGMVKDVMVNNRWIRFYQYREKITVLLGETEGNILDNTGVTNQLFELKKELTKSDDRATWWCIWMTFVNFILLLMLRLGTIELTQQSILFYLYATLNWQD